MTHFEYNGVVQPILKYLNSLPNSKAINIHGSLFSQRGTPDIVGAIDGRLVCFECKRDTTEAATSIQEWRILQWRAAGGVSGVVRSVEEVIEILQKNGLVE